MPPSNSGGRTVSISYIRMCSMLAPMWSGSSRGMPTARSSTTFSCCETSNTRQPAAWVATFIRVSARSRRRRRRWQYLKVTSRICVALTSTCCATTAYSRAWLPTPNCHGTFRPPSTTTVRCILSTSSRGWHRDCQGCDISSATTW